MNLIQIDDINHDDLSIYKKIRENAFSDDDSFIADSPKVVNLLLETNIEIKSILATHEYYAEYKSLIEHKNIKHLYVVKKEELEKIVGHRLHHNCMMHGIRPACVDLENLGEKIIMLDNITSAENVGSIARSAAALGINGYLLPKTSPHPFNRRALRVSMGHAALLKTLVYEDILVTIKKLKQNGYKVFAAEVTESSIPLARVEVPKKWVLIMGHEGKGISSEILDMCDEVVSIEMQKGIKSFNVAVAASIIMYRFSNS